MCACTKAASTPDRRGVIMRPRLAPTRYPRDRRRRRRPSPTATRPTSATGAPPPPPPAWQQPPGDATGAQVPGFARGRGDRARPGDVVGLQRRLLGLAAVLVRVHRRLGDRGSIVVEHDGTGSPLPSTRAGSPGPTQVCSRPRTWPSSWVIVLARSAWHMGVAERGPAGRDREVDAVELDVGVDDLAVAVGRRVLDVGQRRDPGGGRVVAALGIVGGRRRRTTSCRGT